jgi:hypothetical protein
MTMDISFLPNAGRSVLRRAPPGFDAAQTAVRESA